MALVYSTSVYRGHKRPLIDNGDGTHSVPLSQGKFALIDSEFAGSVGRFNWCIDGKGYAATSLHEPTKMNVPLHHLVIGKPLGRLQVDHISRDRLDNRKCNLRIVTARGNHGNRKDRSATGFVGVRPDKSKFKAEIRLNGKTTHLGMRDTAEEAARLYDAALRVLHEKVELGNKSTVTSLRDLTSIRSAFVRHGLFAVSSSRRQLRVTPRQSVRESG